MGEPFELSSLDVFFKDVVVHAVTARNLSVTNNSGTRLDFTVRVPCADKIEVNPNRCSVMPGESASFVIKLRVARLPAGRRRADTVYKEYVFFKTDFLEKRVAISYSLAAEQPSASGKAGAVSRSMEDLREAVSQLSDKSGSISRVAGQGHTQIQLKEEIITAAAAQEAQQNEATILHLQNELQAMQHELQSAQSDASFARAVREELDSSFPDVNRLANLVMDRERSDNEARDARVLALLKSKDERIASLETHLADAKEQLQGLRSSSQLLQSKLSACERDRDRLSEQVSELSNIPALLSQSQKQVAALESRVHEMEPSVKKAATAQRELRELATEIERFRARAAELEDSHRGVLNEQQRAIASNTELSRRAAVAEEQVDRLMRELGSSKSGAASHNVAAYISRIAELENTNSILESSLQKMRQTIDRQQGGGSVSRSDVSMSFEAATNDALKQRIVKLQRQLFQSHAHCVAVATKTLSLNSRTAAHLREAISNSWTNTDDHVVDIVSSGSFNVVSSETDANLISRIASMESQAAHVPSSSVQMVQANDLAAKITLLEAQLSESKRKLRDTTSRFEKELKVAVDSGIEAKRCASALYEKVAELLGPHEASRLSDKLNLFNSSAENFFSNQRFSSGSQPSEGLLRRTELELSACRNRVRELEHTMSEARRTFEEKLKDAEEQVHDVSRSALAQKEAAATRIQELEDVIKRVGSKNDLHRRLSSALMECAQLRASDSRHWSEVNHLRERISMYKADSAAMHRANESLKARMQLHGNGIASESSGAAVSAEEVASLRNTVDSQAREISRLEELLRTAKIDFDRLHVVEEAAADGAAAAIRVRMLERDHDQLKAALSSREFQVKILEAEILRGRNSNKHMKEQLTNALQSLAAAESRSLEAQFISSEQATAADLEFQRDLTAHRKRIGELELENEQMSLQLQSANASLSQLKTEMAKQELQLEQNRVQLKVTARENDRLVQVSALQNLRSDHETEKVHASLSESQSKLALLQQTLSAMPCEDDIKSHAAALALQLSAAMGLESILQSHLQDAALALQESKSKSSQSQSLELELQTDLRLERERSASAEKRCSILVGQIDLLQRDVEDLERKQQSDSSTILTLNLDVDRLQAECNALRRSLDEETQCHRRDVTSLHSSFSKDLNSLAVRLSSKLPPVLETTSQAWQSFAGVISQATSVMQSEMPDSSDHLASIFKALTDIEAAYLELHRTSFAMELRCAVAESRNLSETIARAEYQRSATYYREKFSDTMQQLESITSEFSLLESKRSTHLSSKISRLLELVLSKQPVLQSESQASVAISAQSVEVCEKLTSAIEKLEGSVQITDSGEADVNYVLARFSQAMSLLWTCQTELSQLMCDQKTDTRAVTIVSDQDKQRSQDQACAIAVAETRLDLAQQLATEEVRKREILQTELTRLRELVRSIEHGRMEETQLVQDEARQNVDSIRRELELVISTARRHVMQAESDLADREEEMKSMVYRAITCDAGSQCADLSPQSELSLQCSSLQDQLHDTAAELEQKTLVIATLQEEVAVRESSLLELRKALEGVHVKDGKSKAAASSLAKELIDTRIAATISQRRAAKVEREKANPPAAAAIVVLDEDSMHPAKQISQVSQGASHDVITAILHATLDIRAAVSTACKAIAGQYSAGTVLNHNARALVKKLDPMAISQELRALAQLLRRDLQTLCQVVGVEFVRSDPLVSSSGPAISDNAELIVRFDDSISWLRKQLSEQTSALRSAQSQSQTKCEIGARQKRDDSQAVREVLQPSKNLRPQSETSAKQIDDLKSAVARLKADLVEREKECSVLLSRAVDSEAMCDQLRSEMGKIMHVKSTGVGRLVDSSAISGFSVSMDASQSIPVLLDSNDNQALKHKVLELQKENSSLRVSNAKLGRRITVALTSAALSEKHTPLAVVDQPDVSFSAEDALLAHHQSEIAASEAAVTISSLKHEIRELRGKNSELQQHINSTGSAVSEVAEQCRETSSRLAEYQSLYVECDRRNQGLVEQISEEQSRHRQLEVIMVGLQRDIAESRDRNHALEELVRQLRSSLDDVTSEYQRSLQCPSDELAAARAQVDSLHQQYSTFLVELQTLRSSLMPSSSALPNDTSASAHFAALRDYLSRLEESAAQRERATQNLESELETAKRRLLEQERRAEALASQREEEQQDYEYQMNSMRRRLAAAASSRTAAPQTSVLSGRSSQATVTGTVEKRASSARSSPKKKTKPRSKSAAASAHASASEGDSDDTDRNDAIVELRETRRRLRAAQFDRDLVKDERDALQSKVYAAQQEIIAAVSKSKQSHKDLVESRSSAKALELRLHGLEEQLKAAKSAAVDVADVRASAASFEAALKAARDDAARKSRQFRELAAEKKVVDEQFQELDQQCKSLKDRVKQLSSHNMRLQERIITLTAEAEALAEEKSALMTKQTASTKPAPVLNARSPLDAHVATNVTAPSALKTRSKSPHVVSPASSVHAAVAEIKPKPSEAEAKKDALVRSLQIAAKQQEALVASLREELDRKEKAASAMRKARTDLERRADSNAAAHSQLTQARAEHETLSHDRDLAMSKSAKLQKELIALTHRLEHSDKQIAALTSVIEFVAEKLLLGVEESLSRMHIAAQAAAESAGDNASLGGLDVRAVARQLVASKGDLRSSVQNSMGSLAAGLKNPVDVSGVQQMLLTWLEQRVSLAGSVDSSQDDSMTSRQSGGGQGLIEDVMRMHKELFA